MMVSRIFMIALASTGIIPGCVALMARVNWTGTGFAEFGVNPAGEEIRI